MAELIITAITAAVCCATGSYVERKHLRSLQEREKRHTPLPVLNDMLLENMLSADGKTVRHSMVEGNVVLGSDYFRNILAGFASFFGGKVTVLEKLINRARREAFLRMDAAARQWGATHLVNVHYETCILTEITGGLPKVEVFAYATAIRTPVT
jgi:uncharacterized protein YbjQ (UPF0145 family)